jgi:phosphate transport system permease protein
MQKKHETKSQAAKFWRRGEPFVWATGAALALTLTLTFVLLSVVLWNALGVYWPTAVAEVNLADGTKLLGEELQSETNRETGVESVKFKVGNMEDGPAFRWIEKKSIREVDFPKNAFVLERTENMDYFGLFHKLETPGLAYSDSGTDAQRLSAALTAARQKFDREISPLVERQAEISKQLHDRVKYAVLKLEYRRKQLVAEGHAADSAEIASLSDRLAELRASESELNKQSAQIGDEKSNVEKELGKNAIVLLDSAGREKSIPLVNIVRFTDPNEMGPMAKIGHYLAKIWDLLSTDPRESNQEGGLFPAIFGTVLMVFLMSIFCFPLGVVAGIYLGEYAKEGLLVRMVRIAVNNLAGIPSIVYGIFGMGFFIYFVGTNMDRWIYPERVAAGVNEPVFGQGCILWASLTLGLLTIPVVIVSTEEALRAIPRGIREGSYALGATKLQTLWRVLIPMASPGMMTGFILSMARAAGEVAPLMLTGALKNAPAPFDSSFPFLHADRQFMHLGFHILDISCKSPNVEATKPMVYVTTLLLLVIVLTMSSVAIYLRNRMRKKYMIKSL